MPIDILKCALMMNENLKMYVVFIKDMYDCSSTWFRIISEVSENTRIWISVHHLYSLIFYLFYLTNEVSTEIQGEVTKFRLFSNNLVLVGENFGEIHNRLDEGD